MVSLDKGKSISHKILEEKTWGRKKKVQWRRKSAHKIYEENT